MDSTASFYDKLQIACQVCNNRLSEFTRFCNAHPDWFNANEKETVRQSMRRNQSYEQRKRRLAHNQCALITLPTEPVNNEWADFVDFVPDTIVPEALELTNEELERALISSIELVVVQQVDMDIEFD